MRSFVSKILVLLLAVWAFSYPFLYAPEEVEIAEEVVISVPDEEPEPEEKPLHNVRLPDFSAISDVTEKKKAFFDFIKPHVIAENKRILEDRATLEIAVMMLQYDEPLTGTQVRKVKKILTAYKLGEEEVSVELLQHALKRVDVIPRELALMQAANESAWGTSRFARIGLNFFGQWCYKKGCGMVPKRRDDSADHEVAAFKSVQASVSSYFRNINTNKAYRGLRDLRAEMRLNREPLDPGKLASGLHSYSERGTEYIEELNEMIRHNQVYFNE
ncbi:glucosaminidase domain-containing protein [Pseudoalteromonas fenneropenaei]|uniref:Glucosaminidase domain-containing protein n=1 Tax=Pseudoalteromonas fenneropenaei TaxID=1737459 RepID=A0ABV7CF63_9GAMM